MSERSESNGGAEGTRTPYLFHAMEALYQMSYSPAPVFVPADDMQGSGDLRTSEDTSL